MGFNLLVRGFIRNLKRIEETAVVHLQSNGPRRRLMQALQHERCPTSKAETRCLALSFTSK